MATMEDLHEAIVSELIDIEDQVHQLGLTTINKLTVIARDPENENMYVIVTNDRLADVIAFLDKKSDGNSG